jgi:hypothetical protein
MASNRYSAFVPLLVLAFTVAMFAGELPAASQPEPIEAPAEVSPVPPAGTRFSLGGWRQDLGFGPHSMTFWSKEGSQYTFHSLSLGYLNSWGKRGLFVHASGLFPLQGREDGHVYALAPYYRLRYGGDILTGYQWRWLAWSSVEAEAGAGVHSLFLALKGVPGYRDFSASPFGLGGEAVLRWRHGRGPGAWPLTFGLYGSAAVDLYDPIHGNDLRDGFTFRAGVILGLDPGRPP